MGWGWGGGSAKKKKKATKSYAHWYERLTTIQLKTLLEAAKLPVSGSKAKQMERLLQNPSTKIYAAEQLSSYTTTLLQGKHIYVDEMKQKCRDVKLSPSGNKYDLVLRLVTHQNAGSDDKQRASKKRSADGEDDTQCSTGDEQEPAQKKMRTTETSSKPARKPMEGEELEKRITFRLQKLNKQIGDRLGSLPSGT